MGLIGGYSLHLYCDGSLHTGPRSRGTEYTGQTETECIRKARKDGWFVNKKGAGREGCGASVCPSCVRASGDISKVRDETRVARASVGG